MCFCVPTGMLQVVVNGTYLLHNGVGALPTCEELTGSTGDAEGPYLLAGTHRVGPTDCTPAFVPPEQ